MIQDVGKWQKRNTNTHSHTCVQNYTNNGKTLDKFTLVCWHILTSTHNHQSLDIRYKISMQKNCNKYQIEITNPQTDGVNGG